MKKYWSVVLAIVPWQLVFAAIPLPQVGIGPLEFTNLPSATEFSAHSIPGGSSEIVTAVALDAAVQPHGANVFTNGLLADGSLTPSARSLAAWSSTREAIYTRPVGVAAQMLLTAVRNETGGAVSWLYVQYDFQFLQGSFTPAEIQGHLAYFSLTGQPGSWQLIPEISGSVVSGPRNIAVNVGSWPAFGHCYFLWAHDNAGHTPDSAYLIDNFAARAGPPPMPPCFIEHPANTNIIENQSAVFRVAVCNDLGLTYQWFRDGEPLPGATGPTLGLPSVSLDESGSAYYVVVSNATGFAQSSTATLIVTADTTPPRVTVAYRLDETDPALDRVRVVFSEPVEVNSATDFANYDVLSEVTFQHAAQLSEIILVSSNEVELVIDPLIPGRRYILRVGDVSDHAATPNFIPSPLYASLLAWPWVLVGVDHPWKYVEATNEMMLQGWTTVTYDDSHWPIGFGAFGFPANETLSPPFQMRTSVLPPGAGAALTTCYRAIFDFYGNTTGTVLQLSGIFDDGAVVSINGAEVWRVRLPAGNVNFQSLAQSAPEPDGHPIDRGVLLQPGVLVQGRNNLAVQLHSATASSSDTVMAFTMSVLEPDLPDECPLAALHIQPGPRGTITITWLGPGTLQVSESLGDGANWQDVIAASPYTTDLTVGSRFFRVRCY